MMKKPLFFLLLICACKGKSGSQENKITRLPEKLGSLHGNVFYTYNNFVGNRGDAGAHVRLYKLTDSTKFFDEDVDMSGNFSFDSIPCDSYIMIVTSKNVKDDPFHMMDNFSSNNYLIKMATGFSITPYLDSLYRKAKLYDSLGRAAIHHYSDPSRALRLNSIYKDSVFKISLRYESALPSSLREKLRSRVLSKIEFDIVEVKPVGTKNVVIDFGITYI
jgi:hypothetical protein